jgi:hypothetical protein
MFSITASTPSSTLSSAAKDCIMFLSGVKDADLRASAHLFLKPVKNQSAWRPVLSILNILQVLTVVSMSLFLHGSSSFAWRDYVDLMMYFHDSSTAKGSV